MNSSINSAYSTLGEQKYAFFDASSRANAVFKQNTQIEMFQSENEKANFRNYILDGSLPTIKIFDGKTTKSDITSNLVERLNVQFYGIQYLRDNNLLRDEAVDTYKSDIKLFETLNPGVEHNYKTILKE